MATEAEVRTVRENTNEPTDESFSDTYVEDLVDAFGVASASALIWEKKAAAFAELVTVSEAGASRNMSDLHKNALAMQAHFQTAANTEAGLDTKPRAKVHKIVRS